MGTPTSVKVGPGLLYIAPIGTAEPSALTGAWPVGWIALGYTEDGNEFKSDRKLEPIRVAEELYPIRHVVTEVVASVAAHLAEITATNLKYALNGGTISSPVGGAVTFDPPSATTLVKMMLGWDADDAQERWIFRQVVNGETLAIPRKKTPAKAVIPVEFHLEKPTGVEPFKTFFASAVA